MQPPTGTATDKSGKTSRTERISGTGARDYTNALKNLSTVALDTADGSAGELMQRVSLARSDPYVSSLRAGNGECERVRVGEGEPGSFLEMITGFNTDVPYKGEVYHVQTEDKGKDNPMVESLIYKGGEILGARRTAYEQFLTNGYDEKAIIKFMEDQHRAIISEIKRGKFDKSSSDLFGDETDVSDQSLDQVILNYLATNKKDEG
jgi:hypothetical protein